MNQNLVPNISQTTKRELASRLSAFALLAEKYEYEAAKYKHLNDTISKTYLNVAKEIKSLVNGKLKR